MKKGIGVLGWLAIAVACIGGALFAIGKATEEYGKEQAQRQRETRPLIEG